MLLLYGPKLSGKKRGETGGRARSAINRLLMRREIGAPGGSDGIAAHRPTCPLAELDI